MRTTMLLILAALLIAIPSSVAAASSSQNAMKDCNASWKTMDTASKAATTHNAFMSSCLSKNQGAASSATNAMTGAANTVGGAASSVGHAAGSAVSGATNAVGSATGAAGSAMSSGMASMSSASKTANKSHSKIPVEGSTGTSARCNDGTTMQIHTHSGACSHHGGVAAWL